MHRTYDANEKHKGGLLRAAFGSHPALAVGRSTNLGRGPSIEGARNLRGSLLATSLPASLQIDNEVRRRRVGHHLTNTIFALQQLQ